MHFTLVFILFLGGIYMTFEKETVLKTLFPEDVLSIAKGLTDGEVEFLQQVDSLLESKYRENINQHWIDATVTEDYFKDLEN